MNIGPLQAHNFAKAGLSSYTIEALQRFADVGLPDPLGQRQRKSLGSYGCLVKRKSTSCGVSDLLS